VMCIRNRKYLAAREHPESEIAQDPSPVIEAYLSE